MFNKKDNFEQEREKADKEVIASIIDTRMVMKGELIFEGKARIDGIVEGNIKGEHLVLSEGGQIIGDIKVSTFVCHGTFEGNIKSNLVTAQKTCKIHGLIESNSLNVEPGAKLHGEVKIAIKDLHLVVDENIGKETTNQTAKG